MSQNSDIKSAQGADGAALAGLGRAIAAYRVRLNIPQQQLAREAGVSRSTVTRLESGESVQLSGLVRILQALGLLNRLGDLVPSAEISPMQVLENDGKVRQRASAARREPEAEDGGWKWGEDQ
jgi:putative transcriptional regulator